MTALAEEHLPLVGWVVRDVTKAMPPLEAAKLEDLASCGRVALVEVAARFDPSAGAKFASYAIPRIRGAVLDELRAGDWSSRGARARSKELLQTTAELEAEHGRTPTRAELAERLGVSTEVLVRMEVDNHRSLVLQLEDLLTEYGEETLDFRAAAAGPEFEAVTREEQRHLRACVDALPDPCRVVVRRHFFGEETLTVVAAELGLTLARVSQIRRRALVLLQAALSQVWGLECPASGGGIRARREEAAYVHRATAACAVTR